MKSFVIGYGVPHDMVVREPTCYKPAYSNRDCERPGCGGKIKEGSEMRWTAGRVGYEHPHHRRDDERRSVHNGLVITPKDKHGKRSLYLVFGGESIFLKRLNIAEVGFIVAIGSRAGHLSTRISLGEENEDARGTG